MYKLLTMLMAVGVIITTSVQANELHWANWQPPRWNDTDMPRWNPHPRINSQQYATRVDNHIDNQQQRIAAGVRQGTITPNQAWHYERRLANVSQRLNNVQARNDGRVNVRQRQIINRALRHNGRVIHRQRTN